MCSAALRRGKKGTKEKKKGHNRMVKENKIYLRPCTLGFELANSHEHNIERKIMNGGELNPFGSSLDDGQ